MSKDEVHWLAKVALHWNEHIAPKLRFRKPWYRRFIEWVKP